MEHKAELSALKQLYFSETLLHNNVSLLFSNRTKRVLMTLLKLYATAAGIPLMASPNTP